MGLPIWTDVDEIKATYLVVSKPGTDGMVLGDYLYNIDSEGCYKIPPSGFEHRRSWIFIGRMNAVQVEEVKRQTWYMSVKLWDDQAEEELSDFYHGEVQEHIPIRPREVQRTYYSGSSKPRTDFGVFNAYFRALDGTDNHIEKCEELTHGVCMFAGYLTPDEVENVKKQPWFSFMTRMELDTGLLVMTGRPDAFRNLGTEADTIWN